MPAVDRRWLYAGLLAAAGVGLVRALKHKPRIVPGQSRMLLIGDSLAVGLTTPMKAIAADQRVVFGAAAEQGTRIDQWGKPGTKQANALDAALASVQPTLVLVSLGTNDEYMMGSPVERQAPHMKALIEKLTRGGAEVFWIGPPTLPKKGTNGIRALLTSAVQSDHFFDSQPLPIPRGPDNLHPTARGYAGWAGAVWQWLGQ